MIYPIRTLLELLLHTHFLLHSSRGRTSMIDGVNRELSMVEDEGHDSGSDSYHSTASYVSLTDIEVCEGIVEHIVNVML